MCQRRILFFSFVFILFTGMLSEARYENHPVHQENNLRLLVGHDAIEERIEEAAALINAEYAGKELVLVMVMKGSICLVADLMRHIHVPCTLEYVRASSYGMRGTKAGELTIAGLDGLDLKGKHVLLIDDIFDTGNTLKTIAQAFEEKQPATLKTLVLLAKRIKRDFSFVPDYTLFELDDLFVVGYGLDYKGLYRGLPGIYVLCQES